MTDRVTQLESRLRRIEKTVQFALLGWCFVAIAGIFALIVGLVAVLA